ncbi:MAG: TetR/AcrR family transcriptional regulator [Ilumatobacteraceae bacterium]
MNDAADDELRVRLLDAARRVFAEQGYEGTRIADIVREAGLSTGAVYSRFRSKNDLLREAVVRHAGVDAVSSPQAERVAQIVERHAAGFDAPLTLNEAVRLEAHVAARREPEVARAIEEAEQRWRTSVEPLLSQALTDGTIADDVDPDAVLFLVRTLGLGLLLQRAGGSKAPDAAGWADLVHRVISSFGADPRPGVPGTDPTSSPATSTEPTSNPTRNPRSTT